MVRSDSATASLLFSLVAVISLTASSCTAPHPVVPSGGTKTQASVSPLETQAVVMSMADDYIAALGESVYLLTKNNKLSSKGRWLAQSFLRNGVGASIDIGAGPNPPADILDLLVLASLQSWSFEKHWMPAGIGDAGALRPRPPRAGGGGPVGLGTGRPLGRSAALAAATHRCLDCRESGSDRRRPCAIQ